MLNNYYTPGTFPDGFRFPTSSLASRRWGGRCPFSMRETALFSGRILECESGLEGKTSTAFEGRTDVLDMREQPPALHYVDDEGVARRHVVDLLVTLRDGTKYAVLIKSCKNASASGLARVRDLLAAQAPRRFADFFVIVSEDKVPRYVVSNGRLYADVRLHGPRSGDAAVAVMAAIVSTPMTVSEAVETSKLGGSGFRALVRLAIDGAIRLSASVAFDYPATITPLQRSGVTS